MDIPDYPTSHHGLHPLPTLQIVWCANVIDRTASRFWHTRPLKETIEVPSQAVKHLKNQLTLTTERFNIRGLDVVTDGERWFVTPLERDKWAIGKSNDEVEKLTYYYVDGGRYGELPPKKNQGSKKWTTF